MDARLQYCLAVALQVVLGAALLVLLALLPPALGARAGLALGGFFGALALWASFARAPAFPVVLTFGGLGLACLALFALRVCAL